jgi:signal transduction histidine kinase
MDITDRVQSERALRESEERFRIALSSLPMTVYILDRDLRYTWVYNPLLGMNEQQILGKRDDEILTGETLAEMIAIKQSVIDTCQKVQREIPITINRETNYYLVSLEPICNTNGEVIGVIGASLDVTEQKRIDIERMNALAQSIVHRQLLKNREQERQEIARELHDGPIQLLSAMLFNIQSIKEAESNTMLKLDLDQVAFNLRNVVRELREMMNELRPPAIIQFGFAKSARMYALDFRKKHPEIQLDLRLFEDDKLLPKTVCLALFRIFQEGLNNIVKHASASHIRVRFSKNGKQVELEIRDNGQGFQLPPDLVKQIQINHFGLAGIKERADAIGGVLTISSEPGIGTSIMLVVPIG